MPTTPQRAYSTLNVGFGVGLSADGGFKPTLKGRNVRYRPTTPPGQQPARDQGPRTRLDMGFTIADFAATRGGYGAGAYHIRQL